ncbi:MAG: prepilin-type N-terminal cleavage/methylation domain-containing protein, partial [Phycisphaeraceae bacterium JB051]
MFSQLSLNHRCGVIEPNVSVSLKTTGKTKPHQTAHPQTKQTSCSGFTLIELLVVISIIALLISILLPSLASARQTATELTSVNKARQLGVATSVYAQSFKGFFITEQGLSMSPTYDVLGNNITGDFGSSSRWPLPFASFMGDEFLKTIYIEEGSKFLKGGGWQTYVYDSFGSFGAYYTSLFPSFGLNSQFVGGTGPSSNQNYLLKRPEQEAALPSGLISFTKSRGSFNTEWFNANGESVTEPNGYFYVR